MKTPLLTLGALVCLALTSCVPQSPVPLSSVDTAHPDKQLVGDWLEKNDQETYRITVLKGAWMHVDILKADKVTDSYNFFSTLIGKNSFANVYLVKKDKDGTLYTYTFIRYSVSKGVLKMWSMSPDVTAAAVRAGKLKGSVNEDKNPDVYLTGDSAALTKFIQNADLDKLFTNEATLVRIK